MDCLDGIIGLSQTTCECNTPGAPTKYQDSKSGVYLDQLEGMELNLIDAANDCARGGLWDRMQRAVDNATLEFQSDFLACVQTSYKQRNNNWAGLIGDQKYTTFLNLTTSYAGVRIGTYQQKGNFMNVKKIGVLVNQSVPVTVEVYNTLNGGTLVSSYTINATANTLTFATITPKALKLPLWTPYQNTLQYYFLLKLDGTFKPLNNKKDCGCGGGNRAPWNKLVDLNGARGNTPAGNSFQGFVTSNEVNGIVLDVETKCEMNQVICADDMPLDFDNDGYAKKIAYAIRFKAGELLYHDLLSTTNINRYVLLDGERISKYLDFYRTEYNKWIDFLCQHARMDENSCYICDTHNQLIKTYIRI